MSPVFLLAFISATRKMCFCTHKVCNLVNGRNASLGITASPQFWSNLKIKIASVRNNMCQFYCRYPNQWVLLWPDAFLRAPYLFCIGFVDAGRSLSHLRVEHDKGRFNPFTWSVWRYAISFISSASRVIYCDTPSRRPRSFFRVRNPFFAFRLSGVNCPNRSTVEIIIAKDKNISEGERNDQTIYCSFQPSVIKFCAILHWWNFMELHAS